MANKVEKTEYVKGRKKSSPDVKRYWNNICKFMKERNVTQKLYIESNFLLKDKDPQTCGNSVDAEHDLINILEDKFLPSKIFQGKESRIGEALTKILLESNECVRFIFNLNESGK